MHECGKDGGHAQVGRIDPDMFTNRQTAVVGALCQGKSNKVIAYELNMCESTVKVHVRNIMKKLKAKNRTEVAVLVSGRNSSPERLSERHWLK